MLNLMNEKYRRIIIIVVIHGLLFFSVFVYKNINIILYFFSGSRSQEEFLRKDVDTLYITYRNDPLTLEPTEVDLSTKAYLHNVYEGLLGFDDKLNIQAELAISWGMINDVTWEFHLRPNVLFHNGDPFRADDIVASWQRLQTKNNSALREQLSSIDSIEIVGSDIIRIYTKMPDPLLPQKLTDFYIISQSAIEAEKNGKSIMENHNGTGPYRFISWEPKEGMLLEEFFQYYRGKPQYKHVRIKAIENQYARIAALQMHDTDILVDVPTVFTRQVKDRFAYEIYTTPRLDSVFLLFNFKNKILREKSLRQAISLALNYEELTTMLRGYGARLSQFIPSGVFGYNPNLRLINYDLAAAKLFLSAVDTLQNTVPLKLVLSRDNNVLGLWIKSQLEKIGLSIDVDLLEPRDVLPAIQKGTGDIFLFGWQFTNGDAQSFFRSLVHSSESDRVDGAKYGIYNGFLYRNAQIDDLIEEASMEVNDAKRLLIIQKIMQTLMYDDLIGIPLFQTYQSYAVIPGLPFVPRVDTFVDIH